MSDQNENPAPSPLTNPGQGTLFVIENDELSDDWPAFQSEQDALAWIREACEKLVDANRVGSDWHPRCVRFHGMTRKSAIELLFDENRDSIVRYPTAMAPTHPLGGTHGRA